MKWTEAQSKAISERGKNLLVSAAAGSGKTAVLSERVLQYIMSGGSVEKLLIVTFTKTAAAEMRERIGREISKAAAKKPKDTYLRKQKIKLYRAKISTIDSFQAYLVRQNFQLLDISPRFGVLDDTEHEVLLQRKLSEILEECYESFPDGFAKLLAIVGGKDQNQALERSIRALFKHISSIPFADKWLKHKLLYYDNFQFWIDAACKEYGDTFREFYEFFKSFIENDDFTDKEKNFIASDMHLAKMLLECCEKSDWNGLYRQIQSYSFLKRPSRKVDQKTRIFDKYVMIRDDFKNFVSHSDIFNISEEDLCSDLENLKDGIRMMFDMVISLKKNLENEYKRQNKYTFSTISELALSLLVDNYNFDTGEFLITQYAKELREEFDEVMIDEYQDVNDLQDLFFAALTKNNCFAVGDVKQSIFGFRRANPDNFIKKKSFFNVIDLNMNFRSRKGILDFSNFIFTHLFSPKVGGLRYDESQQLYYGACDIYEDREESDVEIHLCRTELSKEDALCLQAKYVAREIKKLFLNEYLVSNKDGTKRPLKLSDIVILSSELKKSGTIYQNELLREGISVYVSSQTPLFDSVEVNTIFSFLKIIENPYDDLALFIVLTSSIYAISSEEVANIRLCSPKEKLYIALKLSDSEKANAIFEDIEKMRLYSTNIPMSKLLWQIYKKNSYLSRVGCMNMGDIRRENLMSFLSFVRRYESDMGGTLTSFISFVEKARDNNAKIGSNVAPLGNYVRVMTVHASKGLEFPICFLVGAEQTLFKSDPRTAPPIEIDDVLGIGTKIRDDTMQYETKTFMSELIKTSVHRKDAAENLRKLYVAMTRAREKLFIIGNINFSAENKLSDYTAMYLGHDVCSYYVTKASSFLDYVLLGSCRHPCGYNSLCGDEPFSAKEKIKIVFAEMEREEEVIKKSLKPVCNVDISVEEIKRRFYFEYTNPLSHIPAKISVTELSKGYIPDEDSQILFDYEKTSSVPNFLKEKTVLGGALKGSAIHKFLALADLAADVSFEKERLYDCGVLTREEVEAVDEYKIAAFTRSSIFQEIIKANRIYKEEPFVVKIKASAYDKNLNGEDTLLLQGAIDILCEYDDGFIILDYKSDKKDEQSLLEAYSAQLSYYRYAVNAQHDKKVKKTYIWSLHLGKIIEVL